MRTDDDDDDAFDANGVCKDGHGVRVSTVIMDGRRRFVRLTDEEVRAHQPGFRDRDACLKAYRDAVGLPQPDPDAIANESAYANYKATVSNAWRNPSPSHAVWTASRSDLALAEKIASILQLNRPVERTSGPPFKELRNSSADADARKAATASYRAMVARQQDAWKTPVARDGVSIEPDEGDDLVKAIEEAIAKELESRDRRPRAFDPNAANAVEKRLEGERGLAELASKVESRRRKQHAQFSRDLSNAWRSA